MNKDKLKTAYGYIPIKELLIESMPNKPSVNLPTYIDYLYNSNYDKKSAPIKIMLKNNKIGILGRNKNIKTKNIKWIRAGNSLHKIRIPLSLDPKLAYLTGYLYGDGGFKDIKNSYKKHNRFEHKIIVGDEFKVQVERVKHLFEQLFDLQTTIRDERIEKGENMYYINPTSKIVYRFFVKIFGFPEGPKRNIRFPKIIEKAPQEIRRWFIRGFIDADGDVRATEHYKNRLSSPRIKVRLAERYFINQLKESLNKDFKLNFTGPYSNSKRDWYIQCAKSSMINADKQTLFTHPIKRWRLEKFLKRSN